MSDKKSVRSIASAVINFGMVSSPVKIYSSEDNSNKISFNFLHNKCGSRVKQSYNCATCLTDDGKMLDRAAMAKGYEYAPDQFIKFSPTELKSLEEKTDYTISIESFV